LPRLPATGPGCARTNPVVGPQANPPVGGTADGSSRAKLGPAAGSREAALLGSSRRELDHEDSDSDVNGVLKPAWTEGPTRAGGRARRPGVRLVGARRTGPLAGPLALLTVQNQACSLLPVAAGARVEHGTLGQPTRNRPRLPSRAAARRGSIVGGLLADQGTAHPGKFGPSDRPLSPVFGRHGSTVQDPAHGGQRRPDRSAPRARCRR